MWLLLGHSESRRLEKVLALRSASSAQTASYGGRQSARVIIPANRSMCLRRRRGGGGRVGGGRCLDRRGTRGSPGRWEEGEAGGRRGLVCLDAYAYVFALTLGYLHRYMGSSHIGVCLSIYSVYIHTLTRTHTHTHKLGICSREILGRKLI